MITLRKATWEDRELLWKWANDDDVRRYSFSPSKIGWEDHLEWFRQKLSDADCSIYIAAVDNSDVGQVRLDKTGDGNFVIDISVAAPMRGKGLGARLLSEAVRRFSAERPAAALEAHVHSDNQRSLRVFAHAGFHEISTYMSERGPVTVCRLDPTAQPNELP